MKANQSLRCELRGSTYFSGRRPDHLHFLLFSDRDGIKVYQSWNSWGYYARSFSAMDAASKAYEIKHREGEWAKNAPTTHAINKGDFLIEDIYLCDGTWRITPQLPVGQPAKLRIIGRFQNQTDKDAMNTGVWTGQIESKSLEIALEKECVDRLNAERGQGPVWF